MAIRNIDTNFFNTKFVRSLKGPYKHFYNWLFLNCDHGGIWEVDIELAMMLTGLEFNEADALEFFKEKITVLNDGDKWFLKDFCLSQHKTEELNPCNTFHWGTIVILQRAGLMANDFIVLKEKLTENIKPLYSSSKDAKIKRSIVNSLNKKLDNSLKEREDEKNEQDEIIENPVKAKAKAMPKEPIKTFLTPLVEAVRDFKEMRAKKKAPLTERGMAMIHNKLKELAGDNEALKIAILNQSTMSGWASVFPLNEDYKKQNNQQQGSKVENVINIATAATFQEQQEA